MIDETHWERLASLSPDDVCRRAGARYDEAAGRYVLPLLDRHVLVDPAGRTVRWRDEHHQAERAPGYEVALVSVVYLIEAKEMRPAGEWVTPQSLPSGYFFFRGPHAVPTAELERTLGHDHEAFLAAGSRLGGKEVEVGDACVQLQALPRIAVRLVLWLGDEEFPSRVTFLFDRLADRHLPLDALYCVGRHVTSSLLRAGARVDRGRSED